MASGTPSGHKRNSFHRFSQSILQLASPPFARGSFDVPSLTPRKRAFASRATASNAGTSSLALSETRDSQSVYNPTATMTSVAESQTTSHSPLLPPSSPCSPDGSPVLPVPPTTNDLSEEEKLRLMWKVRKLSRVLGEIPVPNAVKEDDMPSPVAEHCDEKEVSSPTSSLFASASVPKARSVSASAKKAFRRSLTFGQNGVGSPAQHVHRAKSLSTLRPSLNIVVGPASEVSTPLVSPITFAWPEGEGPPEESVSPKSAPDSLGADLHDLATRRLKRKDSTASSILLADQNVEQIERARAAKLSRHFGTTIPPEVLRRAASPPPSSPSPSATFGKVYQSEELPRRSASLRKRSRLTRHRRPASLDMRDRAALDAGPTSAAASSPSATSSQNFGSLRRSKSMWTTGASKQKEQEYPMPDGGLVLDVPQEPLSEKQRALNVKRARKMAQLFGDNPPTALFQVTNFKSVSAVHLVEDGSSVGHESAEAVHRYERDSLATIISISTSSTLSKIRDSYISVVTTSSDMSGLLLEQTEDADTQPNSAETPMQTTSNTLSIAQPTPRRKRSHVRSITSPVPSRPNSPLQFAAPSTARDVPRTPPTPPPFSDIIEVEPPIQRPATAPPTSTPDFQHRRRRAAKLSKFFGVEVNRLVDVLPSDASALPVSRKGSLNVGGGGGGDAPLPDTEPSVFVADARKRVFLGFDNDAKEVDMYEAIDQLRRMKV